MDKRNFKRIYIAGIAAGLFLAQAFYFPGAYAGESEDLVCLDISKGSIYITDTGYRVGDSTTETAFDGIYKISGNTREAYEIHVLEGDHVMIMDHVSIDQRTLEDGCPLTVAQDCGVELYLQGDNALFAGAGNGAISLEEDSYLDISGFGQGILSLMAYPANIDGDLEGISAIDVGKDAKITYPAALDTEDTVAMYTGDNRLTPEKAKTYEGEPYLQIRYSIRHHCTRFSQEADCTHAQYCLECGREVAPVKPHVMGTPATCTEPAHCGVCGCVMGEPSGHKGVWKLERELYDGKVRQESMVCTVCHETLYRTVNAEE
ncbi:MAG TPA: hypothetical protein IAB23_07355 [Candidatus Scybalocola faecavium]|nr:hypothetical protein [Candidatus Scybalocola faecavium]